MFMTPAALGYYQETFRQLALEYAVCWFLAAMPGTPARQGAGSGPAARRWSRTAAPPCPGRKSPPPPRLNRNWGKGVLCPAMTYLARGKKGNEPTAAYKEDPTGIAAKAQAQLQ